MNTQKLICAVALSCGLVSGAIAATGGHGVGMSLGSTPPTQCGATGNYECYQFINETNDPSPFTSVNGLTIQVTLGGTGSCSTYNWYIPAGTTGWLWSNPASGGCIVSSVTFSAPATQNSAVLPSALPATPQPFTVASQSGKNSQYHTTAFSVRLTGNDKATIFNISGPFVSAVHHSKK